MLETEQNVADNIKCRVFEEYPLQNHQNASCWEIAEKNSDFRFEYNVCHDCIVYRYSTEHDESAREHFKNILNTRKQIDIEH